MESHLTHKKVATALIIGGVLLVIATGNEKVSEQEKRMGVVTYPQLGAVAAIIGIAMIFKRKPLENGK